MPPNTRRPAGWHEPIRSGRGISRKMVGEWDRTSDPCDVNAVASPEACRNPCDLDEFFPGSFSLSSRQPGANLGRKPLVLGRIKPLRIPPRKDRRTLALLGCHDMNATRHLGHLFAVTFRAPYLRGIVLGDGFGALERLAAFSTTILIGRHVHTPDQIAPMKSRFPKSTPQCRRMS